MDVDNRTQICCSRRAFGTHDACQDGKRYSAKGWAANPENGGVEETEDSR